MRRTGRSFSMIPALLATAMLTAGCSLNLSLTVETVPEETMETPAVQAETAETETTAAEATVSEKTATETTAGEPTAEETSAESENAAGVPEGEAAQPAEKNGEIYILFTSDVHCGISDGFGYEGLQQVRETLEQQGYTTILADNGDALQGGTIGTLTKGDAIINLMNDLHYDLAVPGNHEFDYGADRFIELTKKAEFPYICCNLTKEGELVFAPYIVLEAAGRKIGFVGVTTPTTITSSTPKYFQNDNGEYIYGFMQDDTGETVYKAVQDAVDAARAEGADMVYLMGHLGFFDASSPWTYADVISHTRGYDVMIDGHSHDTDQITMKNLDGEPILRCALGTKMNCIGYSHIDADGKITSTGIWSWPNEKKAPELFGIRNKLTEDIAAEQEALAPVMNQVVAETKVSLTIYDPVEKDNSGNPIRMVRRAETNLGDLITDAFRLHTGADITLLGGGGIRTDIDEGEITYGDLIDVQPFGNEICMIRATGQQILDALEWGAKEVPGEFGGFLHVSGLSYEIDVSVPSGCIADDNSMMTGIEGERRVRNVLIGGEPLDPAGSYTVAGIDYLLKNHGDGQTAFDGAELVNDMIMLDNQMLIDYITEDLGGVVGEEYEDPYGQGRIVITGE